VRSMSRSAISAIVCSCSVGLRDAGEAAGSGSMRHWESFSIFAAARSRVSAHISITARHYGRRACRSSSQVPVSGVRPRSANARHECFVMDASVSLKTAETAELDETQASLPACRDCSFRHGKAAVSVRCVRAIEIRPIRASAAAIVRRSLVAEGGSLL
jgi:hypothetical protein